MKIYAASSWRNVYQPRVVQLLRLFTHEVYDFRNPAPGNDGFRWSEIDGGWQGWTKEEYRNALQHPVAQQGFKFDLDAMKWADTCLLIMPCGRSAHLELGWCAGAGKATAVYYPDGDYDFEPELMVKCADAIIIGEDELTARFL